MVSKIIFACVVFAILDASTAQCIKNLLPGCGCGCGVDVIQNQVLLNQPGYVSGGLVQPGYLAQPGLLAPGMVAGNVLPALAGGVVSPCVNGLAATNIIQDNTVANNLANTLQLLLVSNLLSNTLPTTPDLLTVPSVSPYAAGLSYIC